jgi:COX assembly mitochondrial protein 1
MQQVLSFCRLESTSFVDQPHRLRHSAVVVACCCCHLLFAHPISEMSTPDIPADNSDIARLKDDGRSARLSFRRFAEHRLRQELKDKALRICDPQVKAFAECAQEKGLMVVFSCREYHQQVRECLTIHNGEEAWEKYKLENAERLAKMSKMKK